MLFILQTLCYIFFLSHTPSYGLARMAAEHVVGYAQGPKFESEVFQSLKSQENGFESEFFLNIENASKNFIEKFPLQSQFPSKAPELAPNFQTLASKAQALHHELHKHIHNLLVKAKAAEKETGRNELEAYQQHFNEEARKEKPNTNLNREEALRIFTDILRCIQNEKDAYVAHNVWIAISRGFQERPFAPWNKRVASVFIDPKHMKDIHPYIIKAVRFLKETSLYEDFDIRWIPEMKMIFSVIKHLAQPQTFKETVQLTESLVIVRQHISAASKIHKEILEEKTNPNKRNPRFFRNALQNPDTVKGDQRVERNAIDALGKGPSTALSLHELMFLFSDFLRCINTTRDLEITRDLWAAIHGGFVINAGSSKRATKPTSTWRQRVQKVCRPLQKGQENINPYIRKALMFLQHSSFENSTPAPYHFQINAIDGFIQIFSDISQASNGDTWLNPLINVRSHIFNKATPFKTNIAEQKTKVDDIQRKRTNMLMKQASRGLQQRGLFDPLARRL